VAGSQFGLGDISLLLRFKPFIEHGMETTYILSLVGGVRFPTGRTDGHDSRGDLLDSHIQLGTGSTDILMGMSGFATAERLAFILNLLGGFAGKGAHGHQFGNTLNYDGTVRVRVWPEDFQPPLFFFSLSLNGDLRGKERQDGVEDSNTGGNVTYVSPGLQVFITESLTLELTYQRPIIHRLYGLQLGEDYRWSSGLQFLF
jgi:hypothetical protein